MNQPTERASTAAQVPMQSGGGMSPSMGVAAPIGAVSRRTRARAARTSLRREGDVGLLLVTAVPGAVSLQRRAADRTWETIERRSASRLGRTRLELPRETAGPASTYRVVFAPKNPNLPSWISGDLSD